MKNMKVTGVTVGMVVPNYRKLCELLGEDVRSGKSKICQLKRWERLFRFERSGNSYRILEVFDNPKVNVSTRKRVGEYIQYVEPVLVDYMCRKRKADHRVSLIWKELYFVLGLVNGRYLTAGRSGEVYGDVTGFEIDESVDEDLVTEDGVKFECSDMYWFKRKLGRRLGYVIRSAFRSMETRGVIDVDYEYAVTIVGKDGNARTRVATNRQVKAIMSVEEDVLKEMEISDKRRIFSTDRRWEYFSRVNKILTEEYGWKRAFRRTVIMLNEDYVVGGKLRGSTGNHYKRVLNRKILDYLSNEALKDKETYDKGEYPYNPNNWRSKTLNEALDRKDFLKTQQAIAEYLVKI